MASVRLDADLEARLERAAALRGESKSDFIRAAVVDRIEATLGDNLVERLAHVIGKLDLGGGWSELSHAQVGELISEKLRAEMDAWPGRP